MYRHEFVQAVSEAANVDKKTVDKVIDATLETLAELFVKGEGVRFANFGSFKVSEREARQARNPRTGEKIEVDASRSALFKPAQALKDRMNG